MINKIITDASKAIASAIDLKALDDSRVQYLGKKGELTDLLKGLGKLSKEERPAMGEAINEAKVKIQKLIETRKEELEELALNQRLHDEKIDVTLPGRNFEKGSLHPITQTLNHIQDIFTKAGFEIEIGPEIEDDFHNFSALNIPEHHPARAMHDTFYFDANTVLRTHTSPVQIRTMLTKEPPIYVICPGRTFRADELDATHSPVFHQVEGLVIDRGINMSHLKGTLDNFARYMFGPDVTTRLRPSFFPFTEPSAEVDVFFNGKWIEWGGCGMVNPRVLKTCGIDTDEFSGFAFGMGLERTLMVRHGITDMHDIVEGDLRFTRQFGVGL